MKNHSSENHRHLMTSTMLPCARPAPLSSTPSSVVMFPRKMLVTALSCLIAGMVGQHADAAEREMEEMVVTAQKRNESINDVPMSISALSGSQLSERGVEKVADLQKIVPGFRYEEGYAGSPVYYIRGVGFNEASLGALPNVAVYVDEVPVPFPVMTNGVTLDLERVEVLKGPQGTLFGESSTGGAVNYIAAKPTDAFSSAVTVGYGRFEDRTVNGYVSGPLAANLKARAAFNLQRSGDWQESYTTDDELGRKDILNGRILVDWTPTESLKLSFNANGYSDESDVQAMRYEGFQPLSPASVGRIAEPYRSLLQNYPRPSSDPRAADWGPRKPQQDNLKTQYSMRADYTLTDDTQLTYIISRSDFEYDRFTDPDGMSFNNFEFRIDGDIESTFHELRLSGKLFDERATWLTGLNYEDSTVEELDERRIDYSSSSFALGTPFSRNDTLVAQDFTSKAIFAAFDYALTDQLSTHVSARYTEAKDEFSGCTKDPGDGAFATVYNNFLAAVGNPNRIQPGGCITALSGTGYSNLTFGEVTSELDEDNVSWRAGLDWKPDTETLIYGNVSKGYKAGSYPALAASEASQFVPVTQESLLAYELGYKHYFLDMNVQFNGAVFYYDYQDKQVRGRVPTTLFGPLEALVNVPESEVLGAEFQIVWNPTDSLTLSLNGTYLDTEIKGDFNNYTGFGIPGDFSGDEFPNTPALQANVDVDYRWVVGSGYGASIGGNLSYQDDTYNGFGEDERLAVSSYSILDLRAAIESPNADWEVALWLKNAADKTYDVTVTRVSDTYVSLVGMPRTYGASFTYRFD